MDQALEALRTTVAMRTRRLIIWCGAGLSAPAGIPTWAALQRRLEVALSERLQSLDLSDAQREAKLRSVRQEKNPWIAFHRLQSELGATSFREAIRAALAKAATADMPVAYTAIWKLRPSGLINLNLDRLATRAAAEAGVVGLIEFKGREVAPYTYTLNNPRPFLCNMHGVEEDVDSWVFTQPALKELASSSGYQNYLASLLSTSTVVFLGITVDDMAVGGHLERLVSGGIAPQTHYWITDRRDPATDAWAEKNSIRLIRYKPSTSQHPELVQIIEELASYVQPEDLPSPPVALELSLGDNSLSPINVLTTKDPEQIRAELNSYAADLLRPADAAAFAKYEDFSRDYDRAIHVAWYTSTEPGQNKFLGYTLIDEVSRGAFGIVFKAIDEEGRFLAVKVLHAEIRRKVELLNAFRRGVRSMKILSEKGVDGMVRYRAASEIPATLVMDWIDGPNLKEVVESGTLTDWNRVLDIGSQLSSIISVAHSLPERVLHRDIRPPNMIVEGYWEDDPLKVHVLDFDLSWHRGSVEKSVIFGSQLSGYLAPEQIQRRVGVSTQHASVDSYGLGMTLFYMVSGRDPSPGEHAHANWRTTVTHVCARPRFPNWRSIPQRVARLIVAATQELQEKRWDNFQVKSELQRLYEAHSNPDSVRSSEMLAEEVAARCPALVPYEWNDMNFSVEKDFGTGLTVSLRGDENGQEIQLAISRTATASDNRARLPDAIAKARDNVRILLSEAGWSVSTDVGQGMLSVRASVPSVEVAGKIDKHSEVVKKVIERTIFS